MLRRLTTKELPLVKQAILTKRQDGKCALCGTKLTVETGCQDHDHSTGLIRGVLCRNCNGIEGKVKNLVIRGRRGAPMATYLAAIVRYWLTYEDNPNKLLYPLHRTEEEKRVARNAKQRKKRAATRVAGKK